MKSLVFAAAAVVTLSATPAFAGLMDEIAIEKDLPVQIVAAPAAFPGAGRIVNSEINTVTAPARLGAVRFVPHPAWDDPNPSGGR